MYRGVRQISNFISAASASLPLPLPPLPLPLPLQDLRQLLISSAHACRMHSTTNTTTTANSKCLRQTAEDGYVMSSPYEPINVPNMPLDQFIWGEISGRKETRRAAICISTGRSYTYGELRDASAKFAIFLRTKFKLQQADVLGICLPNIPEYLIALMGSLESDIIVTTINPIYTPEEIQRQLEFSNAKFLVGTIANHGLLKDACQRAGKQLPIACIRTQAGEELPAGAIDFLDLIATKNVDFSQLKSRDLDMEATILLPFSSGTTGMPKGVALTHRNMVSNCAQVSKLGVIQDSDVVPVILPMFHIYGLTLCALLTLLRGGQLITMPQFRPDDLKRALKDYGASVLNLVPPIVLLMNNSEEFYREMAPKLRLTISGAAPIGGHDIERYIAKFPGMQFLQGYGMTETSPVLLSSPLNNKVYDSVGHLVANTEAKIIPVDGSNELGLGPNNSGELCVRGPQVMPGYLNNPEANSQTFLKSGGKWLRTGDVGYYNDAGYFYITDRIKELIKVKGFQVPPAELEAVLRDHPKITEAAVFGVQHPCNGEAPRAIVVLKPNMTADADEIYDYVKERVAPYKRLDGGILFVKEVPKNPTGKILRKVAKEQYSN